jgi:hypothetical protein
MYVVELWDAAKSRFLATLGMTGLGGSEIEIEIVA